MKLSSAKLQLPLLVLFAIFIFGYAKAEAKHWKLYYVSGTDFYFYDNDSIARYNKVIRVSEKSVARKIKPYNLPGALKEMGKIEKTSGRVMNEESCRRLMNTMAAQETKRLYEMRCSQRMYRLILGVDFDKEGTLIDGGISSRWTYVESNSIVEILLKAACGNFE